MTVAIRKFIAADPDKCTGCGICELICSLERENSFNPRYSRIKVMRLHQVINLAVACRFCGDAPCVAACGREALKQSEESGVILVNEEKCNSCGWCILACPYGAITLHPNKAAVLACDLCDGRHNCVEWCPEGALDLATQEDYNKWLQIATANKLITKI